MLGGKGRGADLGGDGGRERMIKTYCIFLIKMLPHHFSLLCQLPSFSNLHTNATLLQPLLPPLIRSQILAEGLRALNNCFLYSPASY